jgi:hypothetical protein
LLHTAFGGAEPGDTVCLEGGLYQKYEPLLTFNTGDLIRSGLSMKNVMPMPTVPASDTVMFANHFIILGCRLSLGRQQLSMLAAANLFMSCPHPGSVIRVMGLESQQPFLHP